MGAGKPPPFVQLDPAALQKLATTTDQSGYAYSDADYARRFPNLVAGKNYAVGNAVANLNGVQDPALTSAFRQSGIPNINLGGNEFQQSRNLGQPILAKEQRDRTYFQRLLQSTPQRAFGLNSTDIAHIALANTGNKTQYDLANFGSKINQLNAQSAQADALGASLGKTVGGIVQQGISSYANRGSATRSGDPYLSSQYYTGGYNPAYQGPSYGQGYASYNLPTVDPDYGNPNYIGLGDTDTSGVAGTSTGGGF